MVSGFTLKRTRPRVLLLSRAVPASPSASDFYLSFVGHADVNDDSIDMAAWKTILWNGRFRKHLPFD